MKNSLKFNHLVQQGLVLSLFFLWVVGLSAQTRDRDPVVVEGSQLSTLGSLLPADLVGFKYSGGSWTQVPIQIDERFIADIGTPYGGQICISLPSNPQPWDVLFYADPNTPIGLDPDPLFDANDELVFMYFDTGDRFPGGECPEGVFGNSIYQLKIDDPLGSLTNRYLYLFEQDGSLQQSAGQDYVDYNFQLVSGQPLSNYPICENNTNCSSSNNGQCEASTVSTSEYEVGCEARWMETVLKIKSGSSTQIDILDAHQGFITPGFCGRTEETFSQSRGPIVNSFDGPVRAIRSVMGSNSGTYNQLTAKFTKYRVDYRLDFRVHNFLSRDCAGFVDAFDFSSNATGMTFYSNQSTSGLSIDGNQDFILSTALNNWELVTGPHGSIAACYDYETNIPAGSSSTICNSGFSNLQAVENYYDDAGTSTVHSCSGDGAAYGSFGFRMFTDVCTDQRFKNPCTFYGEYFIQERSHYYLAPGATTTMAATYANYVKHPLEVDVTELASNCDGAGINVNIVNNSNVSCNGGSDGSLTAIASGGSGSYSYNWSNGSISASITNLSAGIYTVTATDNVTLSTATTSAVVTQPTILTISTSSTNETNGQGNGTADASASGGTPLYSYLWSGPGGFSSSNASISGLSAGTYTVVVTDANGCTVSASVTIINETTGGCTNQLIDDEDFESGWGIWNSAGNNCKRINSFTVNGWVIRMRNGTSTSAMSTNTLNLQGYDEITVSFTYASQSMETGKSFTLDISTNGGASFTTIRTWESGVDFTPNDQKTTSFTYTGPLSSSVQLRFDNNGTANNDWILLDEILIEGCLNGLSREATSGNGQDKINDALLVAPNPATDLLRISMHAQGPAQQANIRIIDNLGKVALQRPWMLTAGSNSQELNIQSLVPGLYFLQVQYADGSTRVQKFLKINH
ncbi:MAG: T9SS type A sorting domain-containing protein [Bacteroidota bacterium]